MCQSVQPPLQMQQGALEREIGCFGIERVASEGGERVVRTGVPVDSASGFPANASAMAVRASGGQ